MITEKDFNAITIQKRMEQVKRDLQPFTDALTKIIEKMPVSGFSINVKTGEMKSLPPPHEWQKRIQDILDARNEYIRTRYPEIKF